MEDKNTRIELVTITALATRYCSALENAREFERPDFIAEILNVLPRIYIHVSDLTPDPALSPEEEYFPEYVDEDFYDSIRRNVESVMGEDDIFLETFEEDMKYSDTPIAASISESLADIFQPLYNFISIVKESDGTQSTDAYRELYDNFKAYWSQTLCNVMRALNHLRYTE